MEESSSIIIFILIVIGILGANYIQVHDTVKESSGTVRYDDCRQKIILTSDDYEKEDGNFICSDTKTISGKSLGGICVKTVVNDSGQCQKAYLYEKPADKCNTENSYLNQDDTCSCNYGYELNDNLTCTAK